MNRHFVEQALPMLGAKIVKLVEPKPEWKRVGVDLYAHRDTGMLKFTPPEPPKAEEVEAVAPANPFNWLEGFPNIRECWYVCSNSGLEEYARYARADGRWSMRICKQANYTPDELEVRKNGTYTGSMLLYYRLHRPDWLPAE